MDMVLPLTTRGAALAIVGGKGANLAKLARAGLPVPDGFMVTVDAYQAFVAANELEQRSLCGACRAGRHQPGGAGGGFDSDPCRICGGQVCAGTAGGAGCRVPPHRRTAGGGAFFGYGRGPARYVVCWTAGHLLERPWSRRPM